MAILPRNARSTKSFCRKRLIQRVDELNTALEKFVVWNTLLGPTLQHGIYAKSLFTAKLVIEDIDVMDGLADPCNPGVTNSKSLLQSLETAVFTAVTEAARMEHVEGNRFARNMLLLRKSEARFFVDVTPN